MSKTVKLSISCTGLRDADFLSKSDPLVTIFDNSNNEVKLEHKSEKLFSVDDNSHSCPL